MRTKWRYWLLIPAVLLAAGFVNTEIASSCEGQAGRGPFNIAGQIRDEQGNPVSGLRLAWFPLIPGGTAPDLENVYYSIQAREVVETVTGADGTFTLADAVDYFDVKSHHYVVWNQELTAEKPAHPYLRLFGNLVDLSRTPPDTIMVDPVALPAGALLIRVTTGDGKPYEGTLPLYFQSEGDDKEPPWELALGCQFVNGQYLQGGLKPGATKVSVLRGSSIEEIKFKNYVVAYKRADGGPVAPVTAQDILSQVEVSVIANTTGEVRLSALGS